MRPRKKLAEAARSKPDSSPCGRARALQIEARCPQKQRETGLPSVANIPRDQRPAGMNLRRLRLKRRCLFADVTELIHRLICSTGCSGALPVPHFDALQRTMITRSMLVHVSRKRLQCPVNRQGGGLKSWRASFGFFSLSSLLWSRSVSCWRVFADGHLGSIRNLLIVPAVARRCLCVGFRSLSPQRFGANGCVLTVATGWISGGGMCRGRWSNYLNVISSNRPNDGTGRCGLGRLAIDGAASGRSMRPLIRVNYQGCPSR